MNKIIKEETWYRGGTSKVAYVKKYILRLISTDGLVKQDEDVSEYQIFDSEDEALQFCAEKEIWDVIILPIVTKDWFPE